MSSRRIEVNVATQRLQLWEDDRMLREWPCSTAAAGTGHEEGSHKTPLGWFTVAEKIGDSCHEATRFVGRVAQGLWEGGSDEEDAILSRILRLDGRQPANENSFRRYIYIHGTNAEKFLGRPKSHGCVRLGGRAMVELFDMVERGVDVWISE